MKSILLLGAVAIVSQLTTPSTAHEHSALRQLGDKESKNDDAKVEAAAEAFLAGYIQSDAKNVEWVANSKLVTSEFIAAFKKAMASELVDADPVIFAQDIPSTPFKATSSSVKGEVAMVKVSAKFGEDPFKLTVTLVSKDGHWLVSKTAPLK